MAKGDSEVTPPQITLFAKSCVTVMFTHEPLSKWNNLILEVLPKLIPL
jgi:hypothetical protein